MKDVLRKHILTICAAISIICMALPFVVIESSASVGGYSAGTSTATTTGFNAFGKSIFVYVLIIGPVLLIAMNYVKQLEKYKGILAVVVPVACIVSLILVYLNVKSASVSAQAVGAANMEISAGFGFGAILAFISYIATAVAGAMLYHNFKFDKQSLERLKNEGASFAKNMAGKAQDVGKSVANKASELRQTSNVDKEQAHTQNNTVSTAAHAVSAATAASSVKSVNVSHTEEVLALIQKLSKMKDDGILTEEEFSEKKTQLLKEI